ncbi:ditrans,polycis-undecaprenyl-diphosphate synthase ((2E,6E)-farnesyl-diphosphate specific) [Maritalea myrionectae]|uniref:Isoprenyl transferase n=1 Tax=Maritalea myrionectae TaxID=454601 RepID=A0A2R4MF35_9HYPH|nr:isoprenyl transferase [Maritalea myrionectae]AVX04583.1 ditrans,polycis-undecaprenyl-diphosphate synthase ((2E,6E)-farnesyl-diphosphate specific) [Maritalea myrionectae]
MSNEPAIAPTIESEFAVLPQHIGVIMDGNGRWATAQGKPRNDGHRAGVEALRRLVACAVEFEIDYLTIFSFSSENWTRPADEINAILGLMKRFVASDVSKFVAHNVRVRILGRREGLSKAILQMIDQAESRTAHCTGLQLNVAFNYGGRQEITDAVRALVQDAAAGKISAADIDEAAIAEKLYTAGMPDPDLIFRSSGEERISNFLLWQAAYAEFVFYDEFWPEFDREIFVRMLEEFAGRKRRFGGVGA